MAYGGVSSGGPGASSPFTDTEVDEHARTHERRQVPSGGSELHRTLDEDEQDDVAAGPVDVPVGHEAVHVAGQGDTGLQ